MALSKSRFYISLYIIIPIIVAGLSIISSLVSFRITEYLMKHDLGLNTPVNAWIFSIAVLSYLCGMVIVYMLLNPMKKFLKEAEKLPALSAHVKEDDTDNTRQGDELVHYANVFKRITDVLNKVDARQLFPKIVGESVAMRGVLKQIMKVAPRMQPY